MATNSGQIRRGLPRVQGGAPWPLVGEVYAASPADQASVPTSVNIEVTNPVPMPAMADSEATSRGMPELDATFAAVSGTFTDGVALRRGLPRLPGGAQWPPEGVAPAMKLSVTNKSDAAELTAIDAEETQARSAAPGDPLTLASQRENGIYRTDTGLVAPEKVVGHLPATDSDAQEKPEKTTVAVGPPLPEQSANLADSVAGIVPKARKAREPWMIGSRSIGQWIKLGVLGALAVIALAGIIVLAARGVTTLPGVPEFLVRYPGEYHLPEFTEPGFPAWVRWTHFLNFFLMVLIIKSGWQVRSQQKPPAFWTPKRGGKKISINLWVHTSLDVLWLVNGVVFVVLLFVSGHWARIVPTSWEVFPNAASALLQYLTLEWPLENGWVNYNSLQQIMYFLVVFVAAPLAAITGVRMSEWWPEKAERLNRFYPAPVARAIHFPTMLFFVLFIIVHVFLVFSTGALRNLNHMFAGTDTVSWAGFWWFTGGLSVTIGVMIAARPLVIAPIANLFGKVSNR